VFNAVDGAFSAVSGGRGHQVFGQDDWAAGGLFQDF
jgi:hypothetical protein